MSNSQFRRSTGRNCRTEPATFARPLPAREATMPGVYQKRQMPLFAQFPPAALFAAIGRAANRNYAKRQTASGTAIAISRLWRAAGGP